jgi:UDP-N-acetylglucosamine--N-acetylmuramyl-(pentapeptide) pyrophosphoryl-undecaprenol N-acetylglucosamine transferase
VEVRPADVVLTGGGTAGHIHPALTVADALVRRGYAVDRIVFIGAEHGLERELLPKSRYRHVLLPGRGIQRRFTTENLGAIGGLLAAFAQAIRLVGRLRPKVVVAVGGYGGVAAGLAGRLLGVPLVTINVDAEPGLANRLLARLAVASTTATATTAMPRAVVTGVPVRAEMLAAARDAAARAAARERLGIVGARSLVAVVGGSLGARRLNDAALGVAADWAGREDLVLYHVSGARDLERCAQRRPALSGLDYRLRGYEEDLATVYAAADVLVARAGAMTVAEIRAIGVPAILVPLPGAPGDHQTKNARALAAAGGAIVVPDDEATPERLGAEIDGLLADRARTEALAAAARSGTEGDPAETIAALVDDVATRRRRRG